METDFLKQKHFSKLMGEGSDIDESDDDLDIMGGNQTLNDSGIDDQPIKLDTSRMSESLIKLVRTIEERIDQEKVGPGTKVENHILFSSVQESREQPVTYSNFDGDPSVNEEDKYKLINDIEQGLNYLYDKGDTGIVSEEDTDDDMQLNRICNDNFYLDSPMNGIEQLSRLDSKKVKHHLYDSSKPSVIKFKSKQSGLGSDIKKRLGEKVKEISTKLFQCRECKRKFYTNGQLQQHLNEYAHRRKMKHNTQVDEKRFYRKSREDSLTHDSPAKLKKFSSKERSLSPEKKVICRHCQKKFFSLENLLYHLRAEHKNRKNSFNEFDQREKYIHSKEKEDSSSQEKTEKNIEFSGSESNKDNSDRHKFACDLCKKTFVKEYDLIQHTDNKHYGGKTKNPSTCSFYHSRPEHKEFAQSMKFIHSEGKEDSSSQEKTEENVELLGLESNEGVSPKTFACSLYGEMCINSAYLDNHLGVVHGDAFISDKHTFVCDLCEKAFVRSLDLIRHMEDKHHSGKTTNAFKVGELPSPTKYTCKFCHVAFLKFQSLKYHLRLAHKL